MRAIIIPTAFQIISFDIFHETFHGKIVILGSHLRAAPAITI